MHAHISNVSRRLLGLGAVSALALALVACGGSNKPTAGVSSVKVFGDSLADSGTFGIKFTVQAAGTGGAASSVFPELVAASYGVNSLCAAHAATSASAVALQSNTCTNFAVGGGRIKAQAGQSPGFDITTQLAAGATRYGSYTNADLLIVDGGGNDLSDLTGAYLGAATNPTAFGTFLMGLVPAASLTANASTNGTLYVEALADRMYNAVKTSALDKGAQFVVVLNAPSIVQTPRFKMVLGSVAASSGATAAAGVEAQINTWTQSFNARLASKFAGDARVAVVDFYGTLNAMMATPSQFGLTDVLNTACPITGVGSDGLPTYNFATCTAAALSATAGKPSPDWWKNYLYSDGFHPTPQGHKLMTDTIMSKMRSVGW